MASAGLESFVTHGFLAPAEVPSGKKNNKLDRVVDFVWDNLNSYARAALPFVTEAHCIVQEKIASPRNDSNSSVLHDLKALDDLYEAMTLNHVARRASKTQGVAILSLYSKGFTRPSVLRDTGGVLSESQEEEDRYHKIGAFVDQLKLAVRREETHGHLPICWGILTAALGLSLGASVQFYVVAYAWKFIVFIIHETICITAVQNEVSSSIYSCTPEACYLRAYG